jgi:rhodanese-related sulfurtransferase
LHSRTEGEPSVSEQTGQAIRQRLDVGEPLTLLDVREPRERSFCSIAVPPTAFELFIPMREVPARLDEIREALDRGPLVVYCHHGVRSMAVAEWLSNSHSGEIINLQGGIDAWSIEVDRDLPRYR